MFVSTSFSPKVEIYNVLKDVLLLVLVYTTVCQYAHGFLKKALVYI
jgi:hypothetical protein